MYRSRVGSWEGIRCWFVAAPDEGGFRRRRSGWRNYKCLLNFKLEGVVVFNRVEQQQQQRRCLDVVPVQKRQW